jgi:hypothetical protein
MTVAPLKSQHKIDKLIVYNELYKRDWFFDKAFGWSCIDKTPKQMEEDWMESLTAGIVCERDIIASTPRTKLTKGEQF